MKPATLLAPLLAGLASAVLDVDLNSPDSIRKAAKSIAANLLTYYHGDEPGMTPGVLPGPPPAGDYYWWEGGAMWGTLVDYWHFTNDTTYNDMAERSMVFQAGGPGFSYQPENWTASLGNDDQGFWGLSAMLAAETGFQDPPKEDPQWLALAQAVFNTQADPARHDDTCGGGLRWQIPYTNNGYTYKNAIANGIFFNMGARLARYTGNSTYADWAVKTWDWVEGVGFINDKYAVYDGGHVEHNCTDIKKAQFSYNAGIYLQGAAFMYDYTNGSDLWRKRVDGLATMAVNFFFPKGVAIEISCELPDRVQCKTDMLSFKGYLTRWMASTTQLAPFTHDRIMKVLRTSAAAAVKSCNDNVCGFRWTTGSYDSNTGVGQQMNVLAALMSLLVDEKGVEKPVTSTNGGTSQGDAGAGKDPDSADSPITTADRAGAGILTITTFALLSALVWWVSTDFFE